MNQGMTEPTKLSDIKRSWNLVDAKGVVLGRISSKIATLLMGKGKPYFVKNLDCGDYVVVINARDVKVTGRKELLKKYYTYSGYPGGLRIEALGDLQQRKPEGVIHHAVSGMLPQNKLQDKMLARLFVFAGEEHDYKDKFEARNPKSETNSNDKKTKTKTVLKI